jgi:catechol 2,3-dioxygenase-like lactoylglutathione lyase family enzyme
MSARLAYVNILAADIEALSGFYARLLGFSEIESHRSPIYRCLDARGMELGFNADQAYDLLHIADRRPQGRGGVQVYLTFEVESPDEVGALAQACVGAGGRIVKEPYDTYYNARQAVLEDPEGNVFRLNCRKGPRMPADLVENAPWTK